MAVLFEEISDGWYVEDPARKGAYGSGATPTKALWAMLDSGPHPTLASLRRRRELLRFPTA